MTSPVTPEAIAEALTAAQTEQVVTQEQAQQAVAALSASELLLLTKDGHDPKRAQGAADQFRHYINKKAKRLKAEAKAKAKAEKASIKSEGAIQS